MSDLFGHIGSISQAKENRMSAVMEKFDRSMRNLEMEIADGRVELLLELWVYARMMMGDALGVRHVPITRTC